MNWYPKPWSWHSEVSAMVGKALQPIERKLIDVSHYQGKIDWNKVREAGYHAAIIKISEGLRYRDPWAARNCDGAREAGLGVMSYHFSTWFNADEDNPGADARAEAKDHFDFRRELGLRSRTWVDMEWDGKGRGKHLNATRRVEWMAEALEALDALEAVGGTEAPHAGVYTGGNFWRYMMAGSLAFVGRPLWLARYSGAPKEYGYTDYWAMVRRKQPMQVPGWRTQIWQSSGSAKVPGVDGKCDVNTFRGTFAEWESNFRDSDGVANV